jgi:hypothetical protein
MKRAKEELEYQMKKVRIKNNKKSFVGNSKLVTKSLITFGIAFLQC